MKTRSQQQRGLKTEAGLLPPSSFAAQRPDTYGVVHLENVTDPFLLRQALNEFRQRGHEITGCWLKLNGPEQFAIVPAALELGFEFHHATGQAAVLGIWLVQTRPSTLPKGTTHTVGVGAMVVDVGARRVLIVKEKLGFAKWKLVTGSVDVGESIGDAAVREVFEETGLGPVELKEVLAMREMHQHLFGLSNMFFLCLLKAQDFASSKPLSPCPHEIAEAKWISLEEYDALDSFAEGTLYHEINMVGSRAAKRLLGVVTDVDEIRSGLLHKRLHVTASKSSRMDSLWAL